MADFYVDHGAYGTSTNRIGLDAPTTWGVPQEGDGFSKDPATASAVAEIQIIAAPTASETITIAGAVITAGAAAAANVFVRGASAAACATNIVTLINSANFTNTVSTNVVNSTGIAANANQGRNLFYAQVKSGASDTVQIMWRIGSAALNHAANSNVAITSSGWASAPTITQFIGGTSGCWGWFLNPAAIGQASSIAQAFYGVLVCRPTIVRSGAGSTIGALAYTDTIWMRSGSGQVVNMTYNSNINRLANSPDLNLVVDSNKKWTGDSGTGVFELKWTVSTGGAAHIMLQSVGYKVRIAALNRGGLKLTFIPASGTTCYIDVPSNTQGDLTLEGITLEEDPTCAGSTFLFPYLYSNCNGTAAAINCIFNMLKATSTGRTVLQANAQGGYRKHYISRNNEFNFNYTGSVAPTVPIATFIASGNNNTSGRLFAVGGRVTGFGSYKPKFVDTVSTPWVSNQAIDVHVEGISGCDVGTTGLSPWQAIGLGDMDTFRRIFISTPELGGSWRYELATGAADWVYGAGLPTLGGLSPGGTAICMRVFWLPTPTGAGVRGFTSPPIRQQMRAASGTKTVVLEVFVPTAITYDQNNIRFDFTYVDTTGAVRSITKYGFDMASSSASWTNSGSYSGHAAKKVTFTTPQSIRQYTDITVEMTVIGDCPTGTLQYLFLDPAISIT